MAPVALTHFEYEYLCKIKENSSAEACGNQAGTVRCCPSILGLERSSGDYSGQAGFGGIHGLPSSALWSSVAARRPFLRMVEM